MKPFENIGLQRIKTTMFWTFHWLKMLAKYLKGNAPENMATLRRITLNLLKTMKSGLPRTSYKAMRKMAGWENDFIDDILLANFMR